MQADTRLGFRTVTVAACVAASLLLPGRLSGSARAREPESNATGTLPARTLKHQKEVAGFGFSPDGRHIAVLTEDGAVSVWDIATGSVVTPALERGRWKYAARSKFKEFLPSYRFSYSADGKHLILCSASDACVWDVSTGKILWTKEKLKAAAASPDGSLLALQGPDGVVLWDVASGAPRGDPIQGDLGDFSGDGRALLVNTADDLRVLRMSGGQSAAIRVSKKAGRVVWWAFSKDGNTLAIFDEGSRPVLWDVTGGTPTKRATVGGGYLPAFSPDGTRFAVGLAGGIRIWELTTSEPVPQLFEVPYNDYRKDYVARFSFSPAGRLLVLMSRKGVTLSDQNYSVDIWDLCEPPRMLERIPHALYIGFSRDGATLAYKQAGDGVGLWSAADRKTIATLRTGRQRNECSVSDPADMWGAMAQEFSPDSAWFACTGFYKSREVFLWDVRR
jgi:WD40 repeat protein